MATNHSTTNAEQAETDHYLVFRQFGSGLELVKQVEVPHYSRPNYGGSRLDRDKRLALAVARAVESEQSYLRTATPDEVEGDQFAVLTELGAEEFDWVEYEQNPTFDAVWDPEADQ